MLRQSLWRGARNALARHNTLTPILRSLALSHTNLLSKRAYASDQKLNLDAKRILQDLVDLNEDGVADKSGELPAGELRARRKKRNQTLQDLQRERYANIFYVSAFAAALGVAAYLLRDWDLDDEQKKCDGADIGNGYEPGLMYKRCKARLLLLFTVFLEPVFEQLLPPPPPEAYRRPLTLVLTLDDLLIHSQWDTKNGWRTAKRPGLDYFLGYLSQYYEIVIFGSNYLMYSDKAVQKLDPYHAYVSYSLFREACRYKEGKLIKDLSLLNRDLAKVVAIDVNAESLSLQPENSLVVSPWDGKQDDYLIQLIPFLEYLATQPVKDVRPIIKLFSDKEDIVVQFKTRELKLREKWVAENQHLLGDRPNAGTFLAKMMGVPALQVNRGPKMPLDIVREHGQLQYQHFQKYLEENGPKFLEEEQKLKEQFGQTTLNKLLTEGAPTAEDVAKFQQEQAKEK